MRRTDGAACASAPHHHSCLRTGRRRCPRQSGRTPTTAPSPHGLQRSRGYLQLARDLRCLGRPQTRAAASATSHARRPHLRSSAHAARRIRLRWHARTAECARAIERPRACRRTRSWCPHLSAPRCNPKRESRRAQATACSTRCSQRRPVAPRAAPRLVRSRARL